ncbi:MAG: hypothetical protein QHG99_06280 [Methanomicrobiales archaeon]|nr:hypothetical protein [Methanomicrobiales archaeon]
MFFWQGDWRQIRIDGEAEWLVAFMADAPRLSTCDGIFDRPCIEKTNQFLQERFE